LTQQQLLAAFFYVMAFVAAALGAYIALAAVLRLYDTKYADFSAGLGKVTAVFVKNLQQKTATANSILNPRQTLQQAVA
jgi:hypothetical protein